MIKCGLETGAQRRFGEAKTAEPHALIHNSQKLLGSLGGASYKRRSLACQDGQMAEWFKAAVLKTAVGGSLP